MTFNSGVLDPYHISADTSECFLDVGYCKVVPDLGKSKFNSPK